MSDEKNRNRPFRRRSYADEDRLRGLVDEIHSFSEKRYPFLVGTFVWLLRQAGKSLAFNLKVVLRREMGVRSYGVGLMVEAFLIHKLYIGLTLAYFAQVPILDLLDLFVPGSTVWNVFWGQVVFWTPNEFELERLQPTERLAYFFENIPYWIGYLYLIMCIGALPAKFKEIAKPKRAHSYGGGESILFGWLQKFGVPERTILMVVEPGIVFVIGFVILLTSDSSPKIFGDFLMASSLALFFEEYLPHARRRRIVQDRIDAQFEMAKIEDRAALMEPEGAPSAKRVPAALADEKDAERYKAEMTRKAARKGITAL